MWRSLCYLLMLALTLTGEAQGPEVLSHACKGLPAKDLPEYEGHR